MASQDWEVSLGPCTIIPHLKRSGILLVTKTECISGENQSHPQIPITKELIEEVLRRHGKDFLELIGNFQKFIIGLVTVSQEGYPDSSDYYFTLVRCYELNLLQRTALLKYLASEIVLRASILGNAHPDKYPSAEQFEKMKKQA